MSKVEEIESELARLSRDEQFEVMSWLSQRVQVPGLGERRRALRRARGIWKARKDLPSVRDLRASFDRRGMA
jgi:hypothetical protein